MRGLTDEIPTQQQASDQPTIQEMDAAIVQLFEVVNDLQVQINTIKEILGASIGTAKRDNHLKGL